MDLLKISFSNFDVSKIHDFLVKFHDIDVKQFLLEFVSFVGQIEKLVFDLNSPLVMIQVCNGTVLITLDISRCGESYCRMLRRRLGLNGLERLPLLVKYSVASKKIVFYVEPLLSHHHVSE